jgi:hypothetical protein
MPGTTIWFEFPDAVEPGKNDRVAIKLCYNGGDLILDVSGYLKNEKQHAHEQSEIVSLPMQAGRIQTHPFLPDQFIERLENQSPWITTCAFPLH